jgi:hypothetical protein
MFLPLDTRKVKLINDKFRSFAKGALLVVMSFNLNRPSNVLCIALVRTRLYVIRWKLPNPSLGKRGRRSKVSSKYE